MFTQISPSLQDQHDAAYSEKLRSRRYVPKKTAPRCPCCQKAMIDVSGKGEPADWRCTQFNRRTGEWCGYQCEANHGNNNRTERHEHKA